MSTVKSGPAPVATPGKTPRIAHDGILDVRDLKAYFKLRDGDVKAVDGVSFMVGQGKSLGLSVETLRFLKDWLVTHIKKSDFEYAAFIRERQIAAF